MGAHGRSDHLVEHSVHRADYTLAEAAGSRAEQEALHFDEDTAGVACGQYQVAEAVGPLSPKDSGRSPKDSGKSPAAAAGTGAHHFAVGGRLRIRIGVDREGAGGH